MELLLGAIAAGSASTDPIKAKAQPVPRLQSLEVAATAPAEPANRNNKQNNSGEGISEAQIAPLVTVLYTALGDALQQGLDDGAILPMEPVSQLAHIVWEAKMASWSTGCKQRAASDQPCVTSRILSPLSKLSARLRDLFEAIAQLDVHPSGDAAGMPRNVKKKRPPVAEGDNQKNVKPRGVSHAGKSTSTQPDDPAAVVRLTNVEVGLMLAAMYFDANALQGTPLTSLGESVGDAAVKFAGYHIRTTVASACSEQLPTKSKHKPTLLGSAAPRLANGVARLLRSVHHALATTCYPATPLARRVAPLALHSLAAVAVSAAEPPAAVAVPVASDAAAVRAGLAAMRAAATDLFTAMTGQAEESLQVASVEELSNIFESAQSLQPKSYSAKHGAQVFTASVLHSVCAATLPVRLGGSAAQGDVQELLQLAQQRFALAEARAGSLVTGILQRTLLVSERESESWLALENVTRDLLSLVADLGWTAAPLFLLVFVKGLIGIANASRNTDVAWTQREFAVRLVGQIAQALCSQSTLVSKQAGKGQEDQSELVQLQKCFPHLRLSHQIFELNGFSEALQQVLVGYHDADLKNKTALLPPEMGSSKKGQIEGAAIPASHAMYNTCFLLCSWTVESSRSDPAVQTKGRRGKAAKKNITQKPAQVSDTTDTPSWALQEWSSRTCIDESRLTKSSIQLHDAVAGCVTALYQRALHHEAVGLLARSRTAALEALLTLLKASPLVHVRRQALLGLSGACTADLQLIGSRCVAEAIALSLQDDSALVRFAVVELISNLEVTKQQDLLSQRVAELRTAVQARLNDASPVVRRAAFRVVCSTIHLEDPSLSANAADLLRRIRHETSQIRTQVLGALERVFFSMDAPSDKVLGHLLSLSMQSGVSGTCFRDLLKTHRCAREQGIFATSMQKLVSDSFARLLSMTKVDDPTPLAVFLEHMSAECPGAFHAHLAPLQLWLSTHKSCIPAHGIVLAQQACKIFSHMIPSWANLASTSDRSRMGATLQQALSQLLESSEMGVVRAATECFCVVAMYVGDCTAELLGHFNHSLNSLRETVEQRIVLDSPAQMLVYRYACIVGTTLEFLNADALFSDPAGAEQFALDLGELAAAAVWLLSSICLSGPAGLRPALVPCLGFLLRRHYALLCTHSGPLEVFASGLQKNGTYVLCQASTVEALASLLSTLQQSAQTEAPPTRSSCVDSNMLVPLEVGQPSCSRTPSVTEAVQRLAGLQADVIHLLSNAKGATVGHALAALQSMHQLGVLHPSSALPKLLAVSLAGSQPVAAASRRLLLQLVEGNPDLLCSRLTFGLREAAAAYTVGAARAPAAIGDVLGSAWRFTVIREAYTEHMEGRQLREQFLDALVAEMSSMAAGTLSNLDGVNNGKPEAEAVCLVEFIFGTIANLPLRSEFELARLVRGAAQFLTLRAMPLLPDGDAADPPEVSCGIWGICVSSVLLHALCQHWAGDHDMRRLLAAAPLDGWSDQPLSAGFFSRRPAALELLRTALREVMAASGSGNSLLAVLAKHVPANSCLLRGPGTHQEHKRGGAGGPASSRRGRKRDVAAETASALQCGQKPSAAKEAKSSASAQRRGQKRGAAEEEHQKTTTDKAQSMQKRRRQTRSDLAASEGGA